MGKGEHLGEFEQVVLLAIARLGDGAHGAAIHAEIEETTGRDVSLATVYVTVSRLAEKGYLETSAGLASPERGGRARKVAALTAEGRAQLRAVRLTMEQLWKGVAFDPLRGDR